jgi:ethanolamine utilization microcompartment shell protein EutL
MFITVDEAREHLRILTNEDDAYISARIDSAVAHLEQNLGFVIEDEFDVVPADIKQAVLALMAHWYENREATGQNIFEVPMGVWDVVRERRKYAWE